VEVVGGLTIARAKDGIAHYNLPPARMSAWSQVSSLRSRALSRTWIVGRQRMRAEWQPRRL
jgi:hypothetical protein